MTKWFVGIYYPGTNPPADPYDGEILEESKVLARVEQLMKEVKDSEIDIVIRLQ